MDRIARAVEAIIDYDKLLNENQKYNQHSKNDAIGACVAQCCLTLDKVEAIKAFTETGGTAKRICKYRPTAMIIACTNTSETCRKLSYYWGVYHVITNYIDDISMCDEIAKEVAVSLDLEKNANMIITSGFGQKHGVTNTIRIIEND